MNETKSERIYTRVTPHEKDKITRLAKKCGLSQAEYLRKRALGYSPKAVQPDAFYSFAAKLDDLCNLFGGQVSAETEQKIVQLADEIHATFVQPEKGGES